MSAAGVDAICTGMIDMVSLREDLSPEVYVFVLIKIKLNVHTTAFQKFFCAHSLSLN